MPPGELRDPAGRDGLPVARCLDMSLQCCTVAISAASIQLLRRLIDMCLSAPCGSLPALPGWLPAAEHSLQKQESDSAGSSGRANGERCDSAAAHRSIYAFGKLAPGSIRFLRNQRLTVTNKMLDVPASSITLSKIILNVSEFPAA